MIGRLQARQSGEIFLAFRQRARIRCGAMACFRARRWSARLRTSLSMIRRIRCRPRADRCAAMATHLPAGPRDQRAVEAREDVLVYSTPALEQDTEVTGQVTLELWAKSSAVDTDFTAKLVDVWPNGFAQNLTEGIVRARYRDSQEKPELLNPGQDLQSGVGFVVDQQCVQERTQDQAGDQQQQFPAL